MKQLGMSLLLTLIYLLVYKIVGFELAVCGGIGQIISAIHFKK